MSGPAIVGGVVAGLLPGNSVGLQNNGANGTTVAANGPFSFSVPVPTGSPYRVTVSVQPPGENCAVMNGTGVVNGMVDNVAVNCAGLPYTVGVTVLGLADVTGLVLQNNGSDDLMPTSSGSSAFKTLVLSGSPYTVTILTQPPGHTCLVQNGSGQVKTADINVTVVCPWHLGYAAESGGVEAWYLDLATGATVALSGSPFAAGKNPTAMALSPGGGFAYVVNQDDGTVSAYAIDAASGALAPIAGSPFAVGSAPVGIVVHSSGKFAYVANSGSSTVTAFSIDPASGALKPIAGSPFAAGGSPLFIVVDSSGKFIYVALAIGNSPSPYVAGYSVDGTTGALTPLAGSPFVFPVGTPNSPVAFAADPQGNFLYVLHGEIYADQIDPLTGALTPVAGSPFFGAVLAADSLVIDPVGKFLYDAGYPVGAGQLIDEWTINSSTGALVRINSSIGNMGPLAVRGIDPSSHFLYFSCPSDPQQNLSCGLGSPATIDATTGVLTPSKSGASGVPVVFK